MKSRKISKKYLRNPRLLLKKLDLIDGNVAYPEYCYVSKKDYEFMRISLARDYMKEYPGATKQRISYWVESELLNLGPNQQLSDAIKSGYVLYTSNPWIYGVTK
jgi:hypothetical protein